MKRTLIEKKILKAAYKPVRVLAQLTGLISAIVALGSCGGPSSTLLQFPQAQLPTAQLTPSPAQTAPRSVLPSVSSIAANSATMDAAVTSPASGNTAPRGTATRGTATSSTATANEAATSATRSSDGDRLDPGPLTSTATSSDSDIKAQVSPEGGNPLETLFLPTATRFIPDPTSERGSIVTSVLLRGDGLQRGAELQPPNGEARSLIFVTKSGKVVRWDEVSGGLTLGLDLRVEVDCATVEPRLGLLAVGNRRKVSIYDLSTGGELGALETLRPRALSLAFQPNGKSLLIGAADTRVYRWIFRDALTPLLDRRRAGRVLEEYIGATKAVSTVAWHPLGRVFFAGDWQGAVNAWLAYDADTYGGKYDEDLIPGVTFAQRALRQRSGSSDGSSIESLLISADGERVVLVTGSGLLEVWKVRGLRRLAGVQTLKGLVRVVASSDDASRFSTVGRDGILRSWTLTPAINTEDTVASYTIEKGAEIDVGSVDAMYFLDSERVVLVAPSGETRIVKLPIVVNGSAPQK